MDNVISDKKEKIIQVRDAMHETWAALGYRVQLINETEERTRIIFRSTEDVITIAFLDAMRQIIGNSCVIKSRSNRLIATFYIE